MSFGDFFDFIFSNRKFRLRVWILEGPFGAVMVDLGPSRPCKSIQEGPIALATTHESSRAHLGPIFGHFRISYFYPRIEGPSFLYGNFLYGFWSVAQMRAELWPKTCFHPYGTLVERTARFRRADRDAPNESSVAQMRAELWPETCFGRMCIQNIKAASMFFSELWMTIRVCITGLRSEFP